MVLLQRSAGRVVLPTVPVSMALADPTDVDLYLAGRPGSPSAGCAVKQSLLESPDGVVADRAELQVSAHRHQRPPAIDRSRLAKAPRVATITSTEATAAEASVTRGLQCSMS